MTSKPRLSVATRVLPRAVVGLAVLALGAGAAAASPPVAALRLVVAYDNGGMQLLEAIPLLKVLPPSDRFREEAAAATAGQSAAPVERSGAWFELRAGDGGLLYRRILRDALVLSSETLDADGGHVRVEAPLQRTVFSILVPRPSDQALLLLFGKSRDARARAGASASSDGPGAREIGRLAIDPAAIAGQHGAEP